MAYHLWFLFNLTQKNIGFQENKIDNKETIALLLHDQKDELKELFPHIWERLLTIRILKEVFQADKEKVCTMYYGVYLFADGHVSVFWLQL